MRIFVSSRIDELAADRKIAVEAIHATHNTPLYVETEPYTDGKKDIAEAKRQMDFFVDQSEGLVLMYYLTAGKHEHDLSNMTPIMYEFNQCIRREPRVPCLVLKRRCEEATSLLDNWFLNQIDAVKDKSRNAPPNVAFQDYSGPTDLEAKIKRWLAWTSPSAPLVPPYPAANRVIIRYTGPDYIGLIFRISYVLSRTYGLNIDHMSHAARGRLATIYISCSSEAPAVGKEEYPKALEEKFKEAIERDFEEAISNKLYELSGVELRPEIDCRVTINREYEMPFYLYLEARMIDAPGQLSNICKVLMDLSYNIDDLVYKPTAREHKGQTTVCFWLSNKKVKTGEKDWENALHELESRVNRLIGVRSFYTRLIINEKTDTDFGEPPHV